MRTALLALVSISWALVLPSSPARGEERHHSEAEAEAEADPPTEGPPKHHRAPWGHPALGKSQSGAPEVLFTFDDGPSKESTEKVLDTLAAHGVRAVFFVVARRLTGAEPRAPQLIQRMLDEHHVVGNHTWRHLDLCLKVNAAKLDGEIDDTAVEIKKMAGMNPVFFRAPYGARCARLENALRDRNLSHMHWDIDPQEWKSHDAKRTAGVISSHIKALPDGERAVVLIHDTHPSTAVALPQILDFIDAENARRRALGFTEIRVVDPSEIAIERLAPGLVPALTDAGIGALEFLPELGRRFVGPTATSLAKVNL